MTLLRPLIRENGRHNQRSAFPSPCIPFAELPPTPAPGRAEEDLLVEVRLVRLRRLVRRLLLRLLHGCGAGSGAGRGGSPERSEANKIPASNISHEYLLTSLFAGFLIAATSDETSKRPPTRSLKCPSCSTNSHAVR